MAAHALILDRYLTEVEEQLRRTQLQATRAERRAQVAEARLRQLENERSHAPTTTATNLSSPSRTSTSPQQWSGLEESLNPPVLPTEQSSATDGPPLPLEAPPSGPADFSWDEQSQEISPEADAQTIRSQGDDERVVDGMASLTVDENEAGYLGVASGAAMLRLLLPDAQQGRTAKTAGGRGRTFSAVSTSQLTNLHWLETPLWDTLNLGAIDLDAGIDAFFRLFHQPRLD